MSPTQIIDGAQCWGFQLPRSPVKAGADFRHFVLDWHNDNPASYDVRQKAGSLLGEPTYFQVVEEGKRLWPKDPEMQGLLMDAYADFCKKLGALLLTKMERVWLPLPRGFVDEAQCGGSRAYGHTDLREPSAFLARFLPPGQTVTKWGQQ